VVAQVLAIADPVVDLVTIMDLTVKQA